jgi:hypothetical protein
VLELGPHFRPVLELGRGCPHTGTVPLWGAQCWNRAPRSGTANLTLYLSSTLNCTVPVWGHPRPSSSTGQKCGPSSSTGPVPFWGPTDTTKIFTKSIILHKIMPLSRNVNHDKMSACHQGHEGYTDCNVGQEWSDDYQ